MRLQVTPTTGWRKAWLVSLYFPQFASSRFSNQLNSYDKAQIVVLTPNNPPKWIKTLAQMNNPKSLRLTHFDPHWVIFDPNISAVSGWQIWTIALRRLWCSSAGRMSLLYCPSACLWTLCGSAENCWFIWFCLFDVCIKLTWATMVWAFC